MKIRTAVRTAIIIGTVLASGLTAQPLARAEDPMAPGSYLNPYVITPDPTDPGRAEMAPRYVDPMQRDILAPGTSLNPIVIEQQDDGTTTIRPRFPGRTIPGSPFGGRGQGR